MSINSKYSDIDHLTNRQKECFRLLVKGCDFGTIQRSLFICRSSVRSLARDIYRKMGVKNQCNLIIQNWYHKDEV